MDITIAVQKFDSYIKSLTNRSKDLSELSARIQRVRPYLKTQADIDDVNTMGFAVKKGKSFLNKALDKLSGIKGLIDAAKETMGLGHPLIFISAIAVTVLGVVGGLVYSIGKISDTTHRKLDLIEKRVLPPEVLTQKPGFKIDLGPVRWLIYIGIGFVAFNVIRRMF